MPGSDRRKNAPRLLDTFADFRRDATRLFRGGNRHRGSLARAGTVLDFSPSRNADESHGRRGWNAGLHSVAGTAEKMVRHANGCPVCSGAQVRHVGQAPHESSQRENQEGWIGTEDAGCYEGETIRHEKGQTASSPCDGRKSCGENRKAPHGGAQSKSVCFDQAQVPDIVCRNRDCVSVNIRGSAISKSPQSERICITDKGVSVQREALPSPVAVFNFQTDTGNYFADGILVHNCDLHARHFWLHQQAGRIEQH
jgi:hypothetical protein